MQMIEAKIKEIHNPAEDYYTVKLETPEDFTWQPGSHASFKIPEVSGRNIRVFSIASIVEEGTLLIGFRTGEKTSDFKSKLISMKERDTLLVTGPLGDFHIKDTTSPIVMFASGVGVTPIRALLKALEQDESRVVEVVYASRSHYLFGDEMDTIADANKAVHLTKTRSSQESKDKLVSLAQQYGNSAYYYVSGAPAVIDSTKALLSSHGIMEERMISDKMIGY